MPEPLFSLILFLSISNKLRNIELDKKRIIIMNNKKNQALKHPLRKLNAHKVGRYTNKYNVAHQRYRRCISSFSTTLWLFPSTLAHSISLSSSIHSRFNHNSAIRSIQPERQSAQNCNGLVASCIERCIQSFRINRILQYTWKTRITWRPRSDSHPNLSHFLVSLAITSSEIS